MNKIDCFIKEYRWLSNFHESPVTLDGVTYPTVEHAYQAAKTSSPEAREIIRSAPKPGMARKLGQDVPLEGDWDTRRVTVMRELLVQKFSVEPLRTRLLDTGDAELIEGNWWGDKFWGVCDGVGKNMLGTLLMEIRNELRASRI